jgi:co-chaperonin GroES (HSP10)
MSNLNALGNVAASYGYGYNVDFNQSGLAPLGRAILVEPFDKARTTSVIALPDSVLRNERILDVKVRVVELGPECYPDEKPRCHPGDVVFIAKMSGFVAQGPKDGKMYRFVNDRDVFAKVTFFEEGEGA